MHLQSRAGEQIWTNHMSPRHYRRNGHPEISMRECIIISPDPAVKTGTIAVTLEDK